MRRRKKRVQDAWRIPGLQLAAWAMMRRRVWVLTAREQRIQLEPGRRVEFHFQAQQPAWTTEQVDQFRQAFMAVHQGAWAPPPPRVFTAEDMAELAQGGTVGAGLESLTDVEPEQEEAEPRLTEAQREYGRGLELKFQAWMRGEQSSG